ncbi:hypothetical protein ACFVGV_17480 [Pseudarthrobacter scleromae]|uniref:hypothetical protein n=1 Tax=Pseudarthrobacter scleromae TaxID=158897 RepID=UPI00364056EF
MTDVRPNLAQLILDRKMGRTFERLAEDCGGMPASRRLQQMANGNRPMKNFPDPDTIRAMAKGLAVSESEIILASARSLGFAVDSAGSDELNIAGAGALPDEAQKAILNVARALMNAHSLNAGA